MQEPSGWTINFGAYGECLPYADNRVTLNHDLKDKWGRPTLTMNIEFKENEKAMQKDMAESMAEIVTATTATRMTGCAGAVISRITMGSTRQTLDIGMVTRSHLSGNIGDNHENQL